MMKSIGIPNTESKNKLLSVSIKGWSAKPKGASLKSVLDGLGQVLNFVHYPAIQSTLVRLEVSCLKFLFSRISAIMPGIRVERIPFSTIREALADRGSPLLTAFVSRTEYFTETALVEELETFGKVRALEHFYSLKSRKWICKITFYEAYSLEALLRNVSVDDAKPQILTGYKILRMSPPKDKEKPEQPRLAKKMISTRIQGCQISPLPVKTKKTYPAVTRKHRCRSTGRKGGPSTEIPLQNIFKHQVDYLSTTLGIIKSRAVELTGAGSSKIQERNHSLDSKRLTSDTTKANLLLKKEFNNILARLNLEEFPLNEASFPDLSEKKTRKQKTPPSIIPTVVDKQNMLDIPCSYLSESEPSDGFTVCEVPGAQLALKKREAIENAKSHWKADDSNKLYESKAKEGYYIFGESKPAAQRMSIPVDNQQQYALAAPQICYFSFPSSY